jgi:hypothetical protein
MVHNMVVEIIFIASLCSKTHKVMILILINAYQCWLTDWKVYAQKINNVKAVDAQDLRIEKTSAIAVSL